MIGNKRSTYCEVNHKLKIKNINASETDLKIIEMITISNGIFEENASSIGFLLYPNGSQRRSAQGMALAGGLAMYRVIKKGFVIKSPGKNALSCFRLSKIGMEIAKEKLKASQPKTSESDHEKIRTKTQH